MGHRNPVRFFAPLALIAVLVGIFAIVQSSRSDSSSSTQPTATVKVTSHRKTRKQVKRRVYVVKSGDNLTAISQRTGVPVERIQSLNPGLDASALTVGQRLRLTP
jgi:LysM repeat protein